MSFLQRDIIFCCPLQWLLQLMGLIHPQRPKIPLYCTELSWSCSAVSFFRTSNFISANQAKSLFILLNNKILHKPSLSILHSSRMFRFFEHLDEWVTLRLNFSWKWKLLSLTANQIIILLLSLIANPSNIPFPSSCCQFCHSAYNPKTNTNACEATNNIALSNELMMSGESTEILSNYFAQAKIKTKSS